MLNKKTPQYGPWVLQSGVTETIRQDSIRREIARCNRNRTCIWEHTPRPVPRPRVGGGDFSNSGYQIVLSICTSRVSDAPSNFFRVVGKGLCTVQNSRGFHHYAIESPVITANLPNFITEITRLSFKVSLWGKSHLSQSNPRILSPTQVVTNTVLETPTKVFHRKTAISKFEPTVCQPLYNFQSPFRRTTFLTPRSIQLWLYNWQT